MFSLTEHAHLGVVVLNQTVLVSHGTLHDVVISDLILVVVVSESRSPRFLVNLAKGVVVPREWVERTNNMPSGAELGSGVSEETANIRASKRNADDVVHHDTSDRVAHHLLS